MTSREARLLGIESANECEEVVEEKRSERAEGGVGSDKREVEAYLLVGNQFRKG